MYCEKCGNELNEGARFCSQCGVSLNKHEVNNDSIEKNNHLYHNRGLTSTIMSVIAFMTSYIPFFNIGSIVMGIIALVKGCKALRYGIVQTKNKNNNVSAIVLGAIGINFAVAAIMMSFISYLFLTINNL